MKLWFVSMECAGIAEAGGVKNVTYSLCKEFAELGHEVTLFIPVYKCTAWGMLSDVQELDIEAKVFLCNQQESVFFTKARCKCKKASFTVVLINHPSFSSKEGVYTYTEHEQSINPALKKGEGHSDLIFKDILFQKAVCEYAKAISDKDIPHIIHCQDASTAVLPAFVKAELSQPVSCVVTIHNAGPCYHHEFKNIDEALWYTGLDTDLLEKAKNGKRIEPFLLAEECGAKLTTVSEAYARELLDPSNADITDGLAPIFASKKIDIKGITNGFDFDRYNPKKRNISRLPYEFDPEKGDLDGKYKSRICFVNTIAMNKDFIAPGIKKIGFLKCSENCNDEVYIAYHGRITTQKGISVLNNVIPEILKKDSKVRFVIAGQGDPSLENDIKQLTADFPGKIIFMNGYNQAIVRLVTAMCDFIVLPSFFEPCGLEDYIAQAYGTLPVAHKTGGLNKIEDYVTGFLYSENTKEMLIEKLSEVIAIKKTNNEKINEMIVKGALSVHKRFYWKNVVKNEYLKFFEEILKK